MRKLTTIVFLIMIIIAAVLVSEADDTGMVTGEERSELYRRVYENGVTYVTLYYQDDGGNLIPVTREVPKQEGIARAAVEGLIDSAATREELKYYGLYPVLPAGTKVQGLVIRDGTVKIDFNSNIRNYFNEKAERNVFASVVYTLTEFTSVQKVVILMDGKPIERLKTGLNLPEYLSRHNTMINSSMLILEEGLSKADLFFWKSYLDRFEYYLPVSRKLERENEPGGILSNDRPSGTVQNFSVEQFMKSVIREFTKGPVELKGISGNMPGDILLLDASNEKDLLTLNFNEKLKVLMEGAEPRRHFLNQILYTVKQISGCSRIKILINGKSLILPEGGDFSRTVKVPSGANPFIDENAGWERQQYEEIRSSYQE